MLLFKPLRFRPIRILWVGQVFSSIGDEIYKVALIWMAAGLIGPKAGYIAALQFGAVFLFGLIGGKWIDQLTPYRVMISADLFRGLLVLLPPVFYFFFGPELWILCLVAIGVAGFSAFFDPALTASLVTLAPERKLLNATNGLFDSTKRFARILGPGIVALLSVFFSTIQFFTIDSLSFFASALSIFLLAPQLKAQEHEERTYETESILKNFLRIWKLATQNAFARRRLLTTTLGWAMWFFAMGLALPLFVKTMPNANIETYACILTAYGFGNLISNFYFTSITSRFAARMIFGGAALVGFGIALLPVHSSLPFMMFLAALAAFGGPMDDLFLLRSLQAEHSPSEMTKILRLIMTLSQGLTLIVFLISPQLFEALSARWLVSVAGFLMFAVNFASLIKYWAYEHDI